MEKLIALLPLAYALFVTIKTGDKALRGGPMTDEDKESLREVLKGIAYLAAAAVLVWFLTPDFGLWTIPWMIFTVTFMVVGILCVIELKDTPKRKMLHNRIWKEGRKTPLYSMSGEPVEHIRWIRRILMGVLILVAVICGVVSAFGTSSSADPTKEEKPAAAAPATPSSTATSTPSTPAPTAPATSAPQVDDFKNTCGGLNPVKVNEKTIDFKVAQKLFICHNGEWKTWSQVNPDTPAPATAPMTYWITDKDKKNGYGVVTIGGTQYLFWTTAIQTP
jgi:hypothetical protein